jgi:uncharacterized protein YcbK (DUF882 family)
VPDLQLTPHFKLSEFQCHCCGQVDQVTALELAERLEQVRPDFGPIHILSGFRCPKQNAKVGHSNQSYHLLGLAADIAVGSDSARFNLVKSLMWHGWKRIGIAASYVHADLGPTDTPLIWTYYA